MPRKNIFDYEKLTLDYIGDCFVLIKSGNLFGSKYPDARAAYNLARTIKKEMEKQDQTMEYHLKDFSISKEADRLMEEYKKGLEKKALEIESKENLGENKNGTSSIPII